MAKGPGLYARDIDIGKPNVGADVTVTNFTEVTAELKLAVDKLEEANEALEKISLGVGLATGVDLDKES